MSKKMKVIAKGKLTKCTKNSKRKWGVQYYLSEEAESVLDGNDQNKGEET